MENAKYIIVETRGVEVPIVFSSLLDHFIIGRGHKVISAGFCAVGAKPTEKDAENIDVSVFGKSVTLKIDSRKEDALIIQKVLRYQFYC